MLIRITANMIEIDAYEVVQVHAKSDYDDEDLSEVDVDDVRRYAEAFKTFKTETKRFEEVLKHATRTRGAGDIVWTA